MPGTKLSEVYSANNDEWPKGTNKPGYTYDGWALNGTVIVVSTSNAVVPADGDLVLTMHRVPNNYEVIYDLNNEDALMLDPFADPDASPAPAPGKGPFEHTAPYESEIPTPTADPVLKDYDFQGWTLQAKDEKGEFLFEDEEKKIPTLEEELTPAPTTVPLNGMTLYAVWELHKYKVTFTGLGTEKLEPLTRTVGQAVAIPQPEAQEGMTFTGWIVKYTYEGKAYADKREASLKEIPASWVGADFEFVAQWEGNVYDVTFNADGGSAVGKQQVNHGEKATKPDDPTKGGYEFDNWYQEIETKNDKGETVKTLAETPFNFDAPITSDITLKAKWNLVKYEIIVNLDGGTLPEGVEAPTEYSVESKFPVEIPNPTKEGFTFKGWKLKLDGVEQTALVAPGAKIETASWTLAKREYTAVWAKNQAALMTSDGKTTEYDSFVDAIKAFDKSKNIAIILLDDDVKVQLTEETALDSIPVALNRHTGFELRGVGYPASDYYYAPSEPVANANLKLDVTTFTKTACIAKVQYNNYNNKTLEDWSVKKEYADPTYISYPTFADAANAALAATAKEGFDGVDAVVVMLQNNTEPYRLSHDKTLAVKTNGNSTKLVAEGDYSIRGYCESQIEKFKGDAKNQTLVNLLHAVLDYGTRAQEFFDSEDEAANATYGYVAPVQEIPAGEVTKTNNGIAGITNVNYAMELKGRLAMNLYFAHDDGVQVSDYTFTLNGKELPAYRVQELTLGGSKYFYIAVTDIALLDLAKDVKVVVTDANGGTYTFEGSPVDYLYTQVGKDSSDLASALYTYYYFANEYFVVK